MAESTDNSETAAELITNEIGKQLLIEKFIKFTDGAYTKRGNN